MVDYPKWQACDGPEHIAKVHDHYLEQYRGVEWGIWLYKWLCGIISASWASKTAWVPIAAAGNKLK